MTNETQDFLQKMVDDAAAAVVRRREALARIDGAAAARNASIAEADRLRNELALPVLDGCTESADRLGRAEAEAAAAKPALIMLQAARRQAAQLLSEAEAVERAAADRLRRHRLVQAKLVRVAEAGRFEAAIAEALASFDRYMAQVPTLLELSGSEIRWQEAAALNDRKRAFASFIPPAFAALLGIHAQAPSVYVPGSSTRAAERERVLMNLPAPTAEPAETEENAE